MRHDKLVRDGIPDVIRASGQTPITRILDAEAFRDQLGRKLLEEVSEFCASGALEELADVLEVVFALAWEQGIDRQQLEEMRQRKARERGGFQRRIYLVETHPAD